MEPDTSRAPVASPSWRRPDRLPPRPVPPAERARLRADFGALVWAERAARGWSQPVLAAALGVSTRTVQRWEGGTVRPTARVCARLAAALLPDSDPVSRTVLALRLERAAGPSLHRLRRKPLRAHVRRVREQAAARLEAPPDAADALALAAALAALEPEPTLWARRRPAVRGAA
ncbi:helix-turn-helix domain-containing protein [Saccharothrix sp. NRRL B-16314]|uniref:helix-turn-helix domain-containing protein n=1 Tax=Saccharothrix sp. NRRL B-16314 TaxID=1463825 RepID=UPI0018CC6BF9|nr:helix-turn-helix transcriptional regulator [Saccharothrix sp. NRRL B-16314]